MQQNYLVISALGEDRPGLVDELSRAVFDSGCSVTDSRMAVMGGEFAILLMVEGNWNTLPRLENALPELQEKLNLTLSSRRTGKQERDQDMLPYAVEVVALDNPGIVHHLANFFSSRKINIRDLATNSYAAAHSGTPMFAVQIAVDIPAGLQISALRDEFMDFCDQLNLDAVIEPVKG